MNRNVLVGLGIIVLLIIGVIIYRGVQPDSMNQTTVSTENTPAANQTAGVVYVGRLPCADCEGIDAVLTLNPDGTYTMSNTYLGRDVQPYIEKGKWNTLRGDGTDPNATVYQLTPEGEGTTVQNYLVSGNELKQLDQDLKPIEAPFNTSLMKKDAE